MPIPILAATSELRPSQNANPPLEYGPIPISASTVFEMEVEFTDSENPAKDSTWNSRNYDRVENQKETSTLKTPRGIR